MTDRSTPGGGFVRVAGLRALLAAPVMLLVSIPSANADIQFSAPSAFGTGNGPHSVAIADLDRDGRLDLAVANIGGGFGTQIGPVSVLLGNGDGTFRTRTDFLAGIDPASVAIADLNADGNPDLAVANAGIYHSGHTSTISVLLGNGDGTFRSKRDFNSGNYPLSLTIGDLNADGHPDLAVGNGYASTVSVLLGNGDGTFRARTAFATRDYPTSLAIADLNADGVLDLAVTNLGDPYADHSLVSVLIGNGDGTFRARMDFGTGGGPRSVAIADLDADGKQDLAVVSNWIGVVSRIVSVLPGNGDGTFGPRTDFDTADYPQTVAIADLDADGRPDLAVAAWRAVSVLLGNEDGTFGAKTDFGSGGGAIAIADLDADGRQDIAVTSSNAVLVMLNRTPPVPLAMDFDFTPGALNLTSRGRWVTGHLEPASPFAAGDIDVSSIRLNGTVAVDPAAATALGDHDGDGVADLMVKFDRVAVELTVSEGDSVPVTITGMVDGEPFSGTDYIRVRRGRISAPLAGSQLAGGSRAQVRWETPSGVKAESVALLFLQEGGGAWSSIARGQPNSGSCEWTVPNVSAERAKVAVLVESPDGSGVIEGVLGVSDAFAIGTAVAVVDPSPTQFALAIRGITPNPAVGGLVRVEFALRDGSPARLELLDVAGRALASKHVGAMGPGRHSLALSSGRALSPGVYFLRLTQGGSEVRARAAVLR